VLQYIYTNIIYEIFCKDKEKDTDKDKDKDKMASIRVLHSLLCLVLLFFNCFCLLCDSGLNETLIPWTEICVWKAEVDDEEHEDEDGNGHSPLSHATHFFLLLLFQSYGNNPLAIGNPRSS